MVPLTKATELASEIEGLGFGALWLPEVAGRDVFVHLSHILSATRTIIGCTGIANIWARDAVAMSGAVKALTEAYPERVLLGLGVSHQHLVQDLRGHSYRRPVETMRAYLEAMDKSPYTAERPKTPVRRVLGALGPKMLRLAAERTDGAHSYLVSPDHTAYARQLLGAGPLLCAEQMVLLEASPSDARSLARAVLAQYLDVPNYINNLRRSGWTYDDLSNGGSDKLVDALVAWGRPEDAIARVTAHLEAGADHVCVQPMSRGRRAVPVDQWRMLAPALSEVSQR